MKHLFLTIIFINITVSLIAQDIYIKIDTREKKICYTDIYNDSNCIDNEQMIIYHIIKTVPEGPFLADLRFEHHPYTEEYVKGSSLKAHRTRKVPKSYFKTKSYYYEIALVIDFNWIESHSWYEIDWMMWAAKHIYIIDKKYETKDSFLVREVDYVDTASQE